VAELSQAPGEYWEEKGRYFLAREDLQGASELDRTGKQLWSVEFQSPVTAVDVTDKLIAWGLLDGSIHLVAGDGTVDSVVRPASTGVQSRYACVYGLALSPDGTKLAVLFGLEPQHFTVFERDGREFRLLADMKLNRQLRSPQRFSFSSDGKSAAGLTGNGMIFYDAVRNRASTLQTPMLNDDSEMMLVPVGNDGFAFLTASGNARTVGLLRQGRIEAIFPVAADTENVIIEGRNIVIQGNSTAYRYMVESR
jgi:hypothetical protein